MVDPGQSLQVINYITEHRLELKSILITHSHHDHIGGVGDIIDFKNVPVYRSNKHVKIPYSNMNGYSGEVSVIDGDTIEVLPDVLAKVIATAGHTLDGVSFLVDEKHLFCGDTLFSAGCGRVFTKDYALMYQSLQKIKKLNPETLIYPGHEYTLNNLFFAKAVAPNNLDILQHIDEIKGRLETRGISIPTMLATEIKINPFLRCNDKDIQGFSFQLNPEIKTELDCFITLRNYKDNY